MGEGDTLQDEEFFRTERELMVEHDIKARGVNDPRVLDALLNVPRHLFVRPEDRMHAYGDHPLHIGKGQTISQPYIVALMTELLALKGEEKVLEVGTGSGYQTAVLALLAKEVYTVEVIPELLWEARRRLESLGLNNIHYRCGDGSLGWSEFAPYDGILVAAGAPQVPSSLKEQLAEGGRLVMPVGASGHQTLVVVEKKKGKYKTRNVCDCLFVKLVGEEGWKEG